MEPPTMDVENESEPVHSEKRRRLITGEALEVVSAEPPVADETEEAEDIATQLPLSRVRDVMQVASDAKLPKDTIKLMCVATELFMKELARKTFSNASAMKKKTITTNDLLEVCNRHSSLHFIPDSKLMKAQSPHKRVIRSQDAPTATASQPPEDMEVVDPANSE